MWQQQAAAARPTYLSSPGPQFLSLGLSEARLYILEARQLWSLAVTPAWLLAIRARPLHHRHQPSRSQGAARQRVGRQWGLSASFWVPTNRGSANRRRRISAVRACALCAIMDVCCPHVRGKGNAWLDVSAVRGLGWSWQPIIITCLGCFKQTVSDPITSLAGSDCSFGLCQICHQQRRDIRTIRRASIPMKSNADCHVRTRAVLER